MKIGSIDLVEYNQFRSLYLDLSYPAGHEKEGLPLDKICFIGQSGTGKSSLLNFINYYIRSYSSNEKLADLSKGKILIKILFDDYIYELAPNEIVHAYPSKDIHRDIRKVDFDKMYGVISDFYNLSESVRLVHFPPDMRFAPNSVKANEKKGFLLDFRTDDIYEVWSIILKSIQKFQEKDLMLSSQIGNIAAENIPNIEKLQEKVNELKALRDSNANPLIQLAEQCLDPLLEKFNLRVKTQLDFKTKEDIGFIKIENKNGVEVPNGLLSTGTQQILLTALPLFLAKPKEAIILFDEPERSLYPDMQQLVIDYYSKLAPDSQFFYATHSPIIASCFEPWEIVELKFVGGYVVQELYYEGERHVDNYKFNPKLMTYDLMLSKVFDLKETANEERSQKITELLTMKKRLELMKSKDETNTEKFKQMYAEYKSLGEKLFWDISKI
jgi:energy-coupling factor transporter ATP-binding protein EcfA2